MVLLIAFPGFGAMTRSWWALALPIVGWPLFYVGLRERWWGYGLGDGWEDSAVQLVVLGTGTTALAVHASRWIATRRARAFK